MKCLAVDDSKVLRKIVRRMIEALGFECDEAADGQEAYDYCRNQPPELIILDWNMPNVTGIEFLQKLRSMDNITQPKVIFCTTENDLDFIQRALMTGADEYMMKPFDEEILRSKLVNIGILDA